MIMTLWLRDAYVFVIGSNIGFLVICLCCNDHIEVEIRLAYIYSKAVDMRGSIYNDQE